MAQRLEVSHTFRRTGNGLLVHDAALPEGNVHAKALQDEALKDFHLDLTHELGVNLLFRFLPHKAQLRRLLLELSELWQHGSRVDPLRQLYPVHKDRLQDRERYEPLSAKPFSRRCLRKPCHRADRARISLLHGLILIAGIDADLIHLVPAKGVLHAQTPARYFQIGQPVSLRIPADLKDPGPERLRIIRHTCVTPQPFHKFVNAVHAQRRAKIAGKDLPAADHLPKQAVLNRPCLQELLQSFL